MADKREQELRQKAIDAAVDYCQHVHGVEKHAFAPGDRIPYGGRIFDEQDMAHLVDASLDFWLTAGRYAARFEAEFANYLGTDYCSLTNSGSSANLLAFMALTSPTLGERRIRPGDEVITVAAGFPTTVTPIIQYGAIPVFVDVSLPTYNIDVTYLDQALSPKTKAVMVAHTLGNPFDLKTVKNFCDKHELWLIEDNCDALGSRYRIDNAWHCTGTIGDLGTSSFYPPHHMTTGEGGAVYTKNPVLKKLVESFRDWGRDCWCASGHDNSCGNRFTRQFGDLPFGYDHKYVYSHFGYNLKITDMQAAIGCSQLEKLPSFVESRKMNWQILRDGLADTQELLVLPEPTADSDPAWFGFPITVKDTAPFSRDQLVNHLEQCGIQTRMLFAGNLIKHPCFDEMRRSGSGYRTVGDLAVTDQIMNNTFWLGVYPGLTVRMLDHMLNVTRKFVAGACR
ncbi:MAG: lipopolysaccharide biosynthesis protein RfbH [Pedobacter sp.]